MKTQKAIRLAVRVGLGIALTLGSSGCYSLRDGYEPDKDPFYYGDNTTIHSPADRKPEMAALEPSCNPDGQGRLSIEMRPSLSGRRASAPGEADVSKPDNPARPLKPI